ncbi:MAG: glycine dehydrogenase (aminomethyl-transferring), partial [Myxococcota bacterium]
YQAEIAQGRMEALVNFQTMVAELTGLALANASLLDEGTAAAEAMSMGLAVTRGKKLGFFVSDDCHPQTLAVIRTRAEPLGVKVHTGRPEDADLEALEVFGVLLQYPGTDGELRSPKAAIDRAHAAGALAILATDLLALTLLTPPGELGADIAVGSAQRFGVPMGAGGPHAAFIATAEKHKRAVPGRIIGVSKDARGKPAYRLALQTREQHIRRDKATSNICTAQVLLAVMAGAYAVYHGPEGLLAIARRVHALAEIFAEGMRRRGFSLAHEAFFDTVKVSAVPGHDLAERALEAGFNVRRYPNGDVGLAFDEVSNVAEVDALFAAFASAAPTASEASARTLAAEVDIDLPELFARTSSFLQHEVFHAYHAEHEMLRYLQRLQAKDLSLVHSMIPLGSCTMKLNATSEMLPVTWEGFGRIHPFAPHDQLQGYGRLFRDLEIWLAEITGFAAVSLQPNAGSQGEYAGLLVIRGYHAARGQGHRNVCLIPTSAHGTNPASAVMAGMKVVPVQCDDAGNIDLEDLRAKAEKHADDLAARVRAEASEAVGAADAKAAKSASTSATLLTSSKARP